MVLTFAAFGQDKPPVQTPPVAGAPKQPAGNAIDAKTKEDVLAGLVDVVTKRAFVPGVDFSKWPNFVEKRKDDIDKADTDVAFARVMNNILRDFGVSHIRFRTPKAAQQRASGTTSGPGLSVKKVDAGLEVTTVAPQGPAGQLGIEVGDIIKEIEGKPATDPAVIQVEAGKSIAIKLEKKGGTTKDLTLEAKSFSTRRVETLTWIGDDAAVLRIWTFANGYDRKNIEGLINEANKKAKYLVIDLRSNGGGAVSNLNHFLSLLMPDATPVGTFVGRNVVDEYAKDHTTGLGDPVAIAAWNKVKYKTNKRDAVEPFTGKIAVLINRGSASASEICSAALKDCRDAVLVGSNSAGAVLASIYRQLPGGFELQFPVQDYVTIKGERLEGHPREPDLKLDRNPDGKDDAADKAIELLKKKTTEHANSGAKPTGHQRAA
jgi:carboxyl-terminal processing protease